MKQIIANKSDFKTKNLGGHTSIMRGIEKGGAPFSDGQDTPNYFMSLADGGFTEFAVRGPSPVISQVPEVRVVTPVVSTNVVWNTSGQFQIAFPGEPLQGNLDGTFEPLKDDLQPESELVLIKGCKSKSVDNCYENKNTEGQLGTTQRFETTVDPWESQRARENEYSNQEELPWQDRQEQLALAYEHAGQLNKRTNGKDVAVKIRECGTCGKMTWLECGHGEPVVAPCRCEVSGCQRPGCAGHVSRKKAREIEALIKSVIPEKPKEWPKGWSLKFLTLSTPTGMGAGQVVDVETAKENARTVWKAWDKTWKWLKKTLVGDIGAIATIEFGAKGMCHLHVIFWGPFLDKERLTALWFENTRQFGGKNRSVKIKMVKSRRGRKGEFKDPIYAVAAELAKYVVKPTDNNMEIASVVSISLWGRRKKRTRGCFYGKKAKVSPVTCPVCKCSDWHMSAAVIRIDESGLPNAEDWEEANKEYLNHVENSEKYSWNWSSIPPPESRVPPVVVVDKKIEQLFLDLKGERYG